MFAMARDNNLPFAQRSPTSRQTRAPVVPAVVIGVLAATILVVNINLPNVIEVLCSVAIVWANLAYLLVTLPLLLSRLRQGPAHSARCAGKSPQVQGGVGSTSAARPYFSMGRWGLPINAIAVAWGLFW